MSGERTRLLQVVPSLNLGGMEQVVIQLSRSIDRDRFDVRVLCLRSEGQFAEELREAGIPVRLLARPRGGGPDYFAFSRLRAVLREERIEVMHTHNTEAMLTAGLAGALARVPTMVHTDHAREFPDKLRYMVAEHLVSHAYYRVVGVSTHTTTALERHEKIPRRKLVTIPNGVDPTPYTRAAEPLEVKRALGIAGRGPVLGIAAKLRPEKRIEDLIEALSYLRLYFPEIVLLIAGVGGEEEKLRRTAAEHGVADSVHFLGMRRDIPDILRALDLMVLPSSREGTPMILLEALAAGVPVVATRVGGIPEIITHGLNGSLVEPLQPGALAREITRLLHDPELRARYRHEGRRTFDERFSARAMARRYEALYIREAPARTRPEARVGAMIASGVKQ